MSSQIISADFNVNGGRKAQELVCEEEIHFYTAEFMRERFSRTESTVAYSHRY